MPYTEPVYTRNMRKGVTVLDPLKNNSGVEWQAHGDPSGGDYVSVPPEIANTPSFSRAVGRKIFEVVSEEEFNHALAYQNDSYFKAQEAKQEKEASLVDKESNRSIVAHKCLGPDERGQGTCATDVVTEDIHAEPPLCTKHRHLKAQFVGSEDWSSGNKITHWNRVALGEREVGRAQ